MTESSLTPRYWPASQSSRVHGLRLSSWSTVANGWTEAGILENYPRLKHEDILAALQYSAALLKEEAVYALP